MLMLTIVAVKFEDADDEEDGMFGVANGKIDPYIRFIYNKKVRQTKSTRTEEELAKNEV